MRIRVLLFVCFIFVSTGAVLAGPALETSIEEFDFGQVPTRSVLFYSLWFRSVGDDTLRIYEIKTGCDCAVMPLERDILPPGDSIKVTLVWEAERTHGLIRRFPRIFTNASPDPYRLKFNAMTLEHPDEAQPVRIQPFRFLFSEFMSKSRDSIAFTLSNMENVAFSILQVSEKSTHFEIVVPDSIPADEQVTGFVRLLPDGKGAEFKETLTLQFNTRGREAKRFSVPVAHERYAP
jgi:hypothetical protein